MVVELRDDSSSIITGMVPDDLSSLRRSITRDKIGLGILFKKEKGHLENTDQAREELNRRIKNSRLAFIRFTISPKALAYLKLYIDSFRIKQYDLLYNGANRPREGEGSGCSAFGMSFLELIMALKPEFREAWTVSVNVPERLIGGNAKKVSLRRIFFSYRWPRGDKKARALLLYEPWLIFQWINREWDLGSRSPGYKGYRLMQLGQNKGLEINCPECFPVDPMFTR